MIDYHSYLSFKKSSSLLREYFFTKNNFRWLSLLSDYRSESWPEHTHHSSLKRNQSLKQVTSTKTSTQKEAKWFLLLLICIRMDTVVPHSWPYYRQFLVHEDSCRLFASSPSSAIFHIVTYSRLYAVERLSHPEQSNEVKITSVNKRKSNIRTRSFIGNLSQTKAIGVRPRCSKRLFSTSWYLPFRFETPIVHDTRTAST